MAQWGTTTLILDNEAFRRGFLAARCWFFNEAEHYPRSKNHIFVAA